MVARSNLDEMMRGVEPLARFVERLPLSPSQRLAVLAVRAAAAAYGAVAPLWPGHHARQMKREADLAALQGLRLQSRHPDPDRLQGEHYLSAAEIAAFERDGVTEPFEVLSPGDAKQLAAHAEQWHETEFSRTGVLPPHIQQVFRDAGTWNIGYSGLFQAHRKQALFDVLASPAISQRMASLLGDEVLCWRSQFFSKPPGSPGTFWHQNSVFREVSTRDKLQPPPECPIGMAQLTAWVALRDVTVKCAALRIMPGSFKDARLEYLYAHAQDQRLEFLRQMPSDQVEVALKAAMFSSGSFHRAHAVFDAALPRLRPTLEECEVRDITMRAGEAVIFTSLNLHASYPNTTDQTRLALAGRYTAGDVRVFPDATDCWPTPAGPMPYSLRRVPPLLVHGDPARCVNDDVLCAPYADGVLREPVPGRIP